MTIYTDKIEVSFSDTDKTEYIYCCLEIRYCPLCKAYKEKKILEVVKKAKTSISFVGDA